MLQVPSAPANWMSACLRGRGTSRPPHADVQQHDRAPIRFAGGSRDLSAHAGGEVAQRTNALEVATAQAYKLAQHDILTGLPNRALLNQRLRQIVAQAARDSHQVACLFLDFDHFKRINDTLGHDAGDQLLQAVAQRLTNAVRESDTVARLGGDEFVIILPGLDPAKATFEIMTVLTRVREVVPRIVPPRRADADADVFDRRVDLPVSTPTIPVELIKQADTAMYAAKDAGRNAYRFFTADMNTRVQARAVSSRPTCGAG